MQYLGYKASWEEELTLCFIIKGSLQIIVNFILNIYFTQEFVKRKVLLLCAAELDF